MRRKAERTLFLGLVSQHGSEGNITNALDVLHGCGELVVNDDAALVVLLDTSSLDVEAIGVRSATDGHKDNISVDLLRTTTVRKP